MFGGVRTASLTLSRPALGQVVGDLHARAARADHEDVAVAVGLGVAVLGRVQQRPLEALAAGPVRARAGCARSRPRRPRARPRRRLRRPHDPARAVAVDALHLGVQAHVEGVVAWRSPRGSATTSSRDGKTPVPRRVAPARELREPAARVQAQAVVAPAPRGGDAVARARAPRRAPLCVAARPPRPGPPGPAPITTVRPLLIDSISCLAVLRRVDAGKSLRFPRTTQIAWRGHG